jgi:hypothetical protein
MGFEYEKLKVSLWALSNRDLLLNAFADWVMCEIVPCFSERGFYFEYGGVRFRIDFKVKEYLSLYECKDKGEVTLIAITRANDGYILKGGIFWDWVMVHSLDDVLVEIEFYAALFKGLLQRKQDDEERLLKILGDDVRFAPFCQRMFEKNLKKGGE